MYLGARCRTILFAIQMADKKASTTFSIYLPLYLHFEYFLFSIVKEINLIPCYSIAKGIASEPEFPADETLVSLRGNKSSMPMKLLFHYYETTETFHSFSYRIMEKKFHFYYGYKQK